MKKIFTLIALAVMALGVNAQNLLTFPLDGDAKDITLKDGGFEVHAVSEKSGAAIDANSQYFGTSEAYEKVETRWKPGGKGGSNVKITITAPENGNLSIYVRSASSGASDRALVVSQNGVELFNQVIKETEASDYETATIEGEEEPKKIFPIVKLAVAGGTVDITWTTNSLNFYGFKFEGTGGGTDPVLPPTAATTWDFTTTTADMLDGGWAEDASTAGRYTYGTEIAADTYVDLASIGFSYGAGISVGCSGGKLEGAKAIRVDLGKQIQLNASNGVYIITGLAKDDVVNIRFASAKSSEERTFTITNGDKESIKATVSEDGEGKTKADVVEETITVASNGNLKLTQSKGINVKAITINADLPEAGGGTGIKNVTTTANSSAIYNLAGQKVSESYKGVVIQNGKKMINK